MTVMTFGACCSSSSAQYVKNVIVDRSIGSDPEAFAAIPTSHYVNDMSNNVAIKKEAIQIFKDVHPRQGWLSDMELDQ